MNPALGLTFVDAIAALAPRTVWLNPGADAPELATALEQRSLIVVVGCTLVALRSSRLR